MKQQTVNPDGLVLEYTLSTADISKERFMIFIDDIIKWSAEYLGVEIPLPDTQISFF